MSRDIDSFDFLFSDVQLDFNSPEVMGNFTKCIQDLEESFSAEYATLSSTAAQKVLPLKEADSSFSDVPSAVLFDEKEFFTYITQKKMNDWRELFAANIYEINVVVQDRFLCDFFSNPFRAFPLPGDKVIVPELCPFYFCVYSLDNFSKSYSDLLRRKDGAPIILSPAQQLIYVLNAVYQDQLEFPFFSLTTQYYFFVTLMSTPKNHLLFEAESRSVHFKSLPGSCFGYLKPIDTLSTPRIQLPGHYFLTTRLSSQLQQALDTYFPGDDASVKPSRLSHTAVSRHTPVALSGSGRDISPSLGGQSDAQSLAIGFQNKTGDYAAKRKKHTHDGSGLFASVYHSAQHALSKSHTPFEQDQFPLAGSDFPAVDFQKDCDCFVKRGECENRRLGLFDSNSDIVRSPGHTRNFVFSFNPPSSGRPDA